MKIYKIINTAKYYIGKLTDNLERAKTEKQRDFMMDMIDGFIDLVNAAEYLVNSQNQTDIVDSLILSKIYDQLNEQEYRSYNWAQKIYVLEKSGDSYNYLGYVEKDGIIEANHLMQYHDIKEMVLAMVDGTEVVLPQHTSAKLIDEMHRSKLDVVDMRAIVDAVDFDITHNPESNREKVVTKLRAIKSMQLVPSEEVNMMVIDLLNQFKNQLPWKS